MANLRGSMRALVTGGAGHIGSHLVEALVAHDVDVVVIDDLSTGCVDNLSAVPDTIDVVEADVRDRAVLDRVVGSVDVVYHLAASVGVSHVLADPIAAIGCNLDGTRTVVDACAEHRARLVFASTSEVYGKSPRLPMHEDDPLVIGAPTSRRWSYALTKALDEHLVLEAGRHGLPVTVLRYFNSYGPRASHGGDASVVARFALQALRGEPLTVYGSGEQTRCFTHVSDIAEATRLAGAHDATVGRVCNVGSEQPISMIDLAGRIADLVDPTLPVLSVDPRRHLGADFDETIHRRPSTGRVRRLTGWAPRIAFGEGLPATVDWYAARLPTVAPRSGQRSAALPHAAAPMPASHLRGSSA